MDREVRRRQPERPARRGRPPEVRVLRRPQARGGEARPQQWVDYDTQTRQIKAVPRLPDWAQPHHSKTANRVNGKPAGISREQWEQIKAGLAKHSISQRKFLDHFSAKKPGDIPQTAFDEALALAQNPSEALLLDAAPAA
jgi:hypothetical protein